MANDIFLVYRSHYAGPLSKSVSRLPAPTVLAWFQARWLEALAAGSEDEAWDVADAAGTNLYGLGSLFKKVYEQRIEPPETTDDLRRLLRAHLYFEGGPEFCMVDDHTVRVRTDDDEVGLAYFFFDAIWAEANPDRAAYLLQEDWALPAGAAEVSAFSEPAGLELEALGSEPEPGGAGQTWAVLLTFYDSDSIDAAVACRFPGARLPLLAAHLRAARPRTRTVEVSERYSYTHSWPLELRVLRALVADGDQTLEPALRRAGGFPIQALGQGRHRALGLGDHPDAARELAERVAEIPAGRRFPKPGEPGKSLVAASPHLAQLCHHATRAFGYQQWFLFDDLWATANPDLAASLLRYADCWDPAG